MRRTGWLALSAWLAVAVAMSSVAAEQAFYSPAVGKAYPRQVCIPTCLLMLPPVVIASLVQTPPTGSPKVKR